MKSLVLLILIFPFTCLAQEYDGLKTINGTKLYLKVIGKGEPLVVLHGGPGLNHAYFRPYLDELGKKFKLVYYDQRSCGGSSIPSVDSISMKFFVEDLEAIRKYLGVDKLNILAHSWGAILAVNYALTYPDQVGKMILSNPAMLSREYDQEVAAFMKKKTTKQDSTEQAQLISSGNLDGKGYDKLFKLSFRSSAYNPKNIDKLNLHLPANFTEANQALFTGLSKDGMDQNYYDAVKSFNFPVVIIQGKADGIPIASVTRLQSQIPHSSLQVFQRSGHFPFVEETKKYQKVIVTFLKEK